MGFPRIVCPGSEKTLRAFTGRSVALRMNGCHDLAETVAAVQKSGNTLFCIIVASDRPLADMEFTDQHRGIPLAVRAPALGRFRDLARNLDHLRTLNLRVYLPCDRSDNLTGLRILSSVGIHSCADFRHGSPDWQALADLAAYAVLERTPHAAMEPFAFMAVNYYTANRLDWGRVLFDDPGHYLHVDQEGRVALSQAELAEDRFVASSLSEIAAPEKFPPIRERLRSWRRYFADNHPCAFCGGWRLCLGKFSQDPATAPGCREFFMEMIDLARQYQALQAAMEEPDIWQP